MDKYSARFSKASRTFLSGKPQDSKKKKCQKSQPVLQVQV
jgi:hypothetical protein